MRKKVLGTLAALAASAGGALAQSPGRGPAPAGYPDATPAQFVNTVPAIPAMLPPGEMPVPSGDPNALAPNGLPPGGLPTYPNGGAYGQSPFDSPAMERSGLFGGRRSAGNPGLWFDGSYLLLFPKSQPLGYPLLTTSAPADAGVVGRPTTTILQGNGGEIPLGNASGFRLSAGYFRPSDQRIGGEFIGTYMAPISNNYFASTSSVSNGIPVLARPFINAGTGAGNGLLASFPTYNYGSALSHVSTQYWGLEANSLVNLYRTGEGDTRHWVLNWLVGFRYNQLAEIIDVTSRGTLLPGATGSYNGVTIASPTSVEIRDTFRTRNHFYGGQTGFQSQFSSGRFYVGVTGKIAIGFVHQEIDVTGTTNASNAATQTSSFGVGGLLANASNIGTYRNDRFAAMTDLNGTLGYHVTPWLIGTIGYNFQHISRVVRPGSQFNGRVDPTLIPSSGSFGGASTGGQAFNIKEEDFYLHGLNFGAIIRY